MNESSRFTQITRHAALEAVRQYFWPLKFVAQCCHRMWRLLFGGTTPEVSADNPVRVTSTNSPQGSKDVSVRP